MVGTCTDSKFAESNLLAYKMDVQLNMLGSSMMNWIGGHIHRRHIVTEDDRGLGEVAVELAKQLTKPDAISDRIGDGAIFRLRTRARDGGLSLGGPADKRAAEVDTVTGGGTACVRAARPIRVRVGDDVGGGCRSEE